MSGSARQPQQLFDLTDRVVLVTGGSRGLGREMAFAAATISDNPALTRSANAPTSTEAGSLPLAILSQSSCRSARTCSSGT